jgi:hypothetical protein
MGLHHGWWSPRTFTWRQDRRRRHLGHIETQEDGVERAAGETVQQDATLPAISNGQRRSAIRVCRTFRNPSSTADAPSLQALSDLKGGGHLLGHLRRIHPRPGVLGDHAVDFRAWYQQPPANLHRGDYAVVGFPPSGLALCCLALDRVPPI